MTDETLLSGQGGGQFKILSANPIDHGSTSQLFLGEQVTPEGQAGRKVAVKMALGSDQRQVFEKEAEVLSLLWDMIPGAVPEFYTSNLEAERPYLVMEYLASVRSLADFARDRPEGHSPEKEAVHWATRYGELLSALHDVDFTAPDRKLGDLLLVEQTTLTGDDRPLLSDTGGDDWRLVVVDWGGVASLTPSLADFDLLLFTQFWYRLLLGGHSLPDVRLGTRRPEHHRRWSELSYGARQILSRGLSRVAQRRYRGIVELLGDWRELGAFWNQTPAELERTFEQARRAKAYDKALKCLDTLRLVDPPRWRKYEDEVDALLSEIDIAGVLARQITEAIRRGETLADSNIRQPLTRGAEAYGDDPEWQLRAQRWKILAEFSGSLSTEAQHVFREEVVGPWGEAIEAIEGERWEEALDLFWQPLPRVVSPNQENPDIEAKIHLARESLHSGERIEAQECIRAGVEDLSALEPAPATAVIDLLNNAFLPQYSQWGGILSLLIEAELRNHMLNLAANLARGRPEEVYASSDAVRALQGQLSYQPLLGEAGALWSPDSLKRLDRQLDVCRKADDVLAEAAELADKGKFQQAKWILEATDRDFDFTTRSGPDSAQNLLAEVDALAGKKRHQVKAEWKRVLDLIQADQLLEQSAGSDDVFQVLAALEAASEARGNSYLKRRAAKVIDEVERVLQSGPALVTLEEKPRSMAEGEVA
jgi:hypothetical protein